MRLKVVHRDGRIETLTIVPPVYFEAGETLWFLRGGDGTEHWFQVDDGTYDGWGRAVNLPSVESAAEEITRIEESREIDDSSGD